MLCWPVEPMRATGAPVLPAVRRGSDRLYEIKFDGFRAVDQVGADGVRLQSRQGKDLTRYLPDVAAALAGHLTAGVVLEGEVLIWDPVKGRTAFSLLQRRLTAGRQVARVAAAAPAHFVAFDLLCDGTDGEMLSEPLTVRRAVARAAA